MSLRCLPERALLAMLLCAGSALAAEPLKVCADPDNLPYSNADGSGFELRIAAVMADALKRDLHIVWQPLRRGFVRKTLGAAECELLVGVPEDFERVAATRPYYRSSYVLVTRRDDPAPLTGWSDPRLARLRIGVMLVGNDLAATPVGHALAQLGAAEHVRGFTVFGDGPAAERMLQALANGELDAAMLWGPQAGYFAARSVVPMRVAALQPPAGLGMPFEFAIALGVRRGEADKPLHEALNAALEQRRAEIDAILAEYHVPRSDKEAPR
jgi:quinoprotein dehydrogenase-associated probable ABC transporter substrate-binding protein